MCVCVCVCVCTKGSTSDAIKDLNLAYRVYFLLRYICTYTYELKCFDKESQILQDYLINNKNLSFYEGHSIDTVIFCKLLYIRDPFVNSNT